MFKKDNAKGRGRSPELTRTTLTSLSSMQGA